MINFIKKNIIFLFFDLIVLFPIVFVIVKQNHISFETIFYMIKTIFKLIV